MNPLAVVSAVSGGYGVLRVWRGWFPQRAPLAQVLARADARMDPRPILSPSERRSAAAWLGHHAENAGRLLLPAVRADLRIVGKSLPQHIGLKVALCLAGLLVPAASASALAVLGVQLPAAPVAVLGTLMALLAFVLPDLSVRSEAALRRREFRHGLVPYIGLVASALAGGSGIEGALWDCAAVGTRDRTATGSPGTAGPPGWVLRHIRAALHRARLTRQPSWKALRQLAGEIGVTELDEVASTIALADVLGARIRDSLNAKAQSLSFRLQSEEERKANRGIDGMIGPLMFFVFAVLLVFLYPLFSRLFTAH